MKASAPPRAEPAPGPSFSKAGAASGPVGVARGGTRDVPASGIGSARHRLGAISFASPVQRRVPIGRPASPTPAGRGPGLPADLRAGIESLSGVSMEGVRVHYNSPKPAQLRAEAFAQGRDIHVAPGREQHLSHEAWHLTQQAQGRVPATMQAKGLPINDNPELETEADVMGAKALRIGRAKVAAAQQPQATGSPSADALGR